MKIYLILFFYILLLFSCSNYGENENRKVDTKLETLELRVTDSILLPLPSSVSHIINSLDYDKENNEIVFYTNDTIFLFKKNKLCNKLPLSEKINTFSSFKNSFIALNYGKKEIYNIDSIGNIKNVYHISPNIQYSPLPIVKIAPIIKDNNKIIFFGNVSGEYANEDNRKVIGVYNLDNSSTVYYGSYPNIYKKNWGGGLFRWVYADYNSKTRKIIVSFPASHYIEVYNIDDMSPVETYFAGSKLIKSTNYLNSSKILPIESETKIKHFVETPSYSRIIYDSYRNLYYRIAEMKSKYDGVIGWKKDISIIILDDSFKRVGETFIGETLSNNRYTVYVDEEGLKIPVVSSEDYLKFKNYKICSIKK